MEEIQHLNKQIDFDNLSYRYKGNNDLKPFIGFKVHQVFIKNIKECNMTLEKAGEEQK